MEYKLKISDVIKVVIFVASLLGMWYSTKYQVDALTEKVSKLERQLEETNLGVIKNDIEYIKEGQKKHFPSHHQSVQWQRIGRKFRSATTGKIECGIDIA